MYSGVCGRGGNTYCGSSSLSDQACIIPERLAELDGLCEAVTTKNGIRIMDTLKFFKGDIPASNAGISCGGHFPCVGCVCSASHFLNFAHASYCDQRTFESRCIWQKIRSLEVL